MSETEIRMMRYTIEQLSAELQATRQYVSDIKSKLERTRKALGIAKHALQRIQFRGSHSKFWVGKDDGTIALKALNKITALEQKEQ